MTHDTAYRELTTKHNTMSFLSDIGRVSARKDRGEYIVTIEQFQSDTVTRMRFKTMRGALIAYEGSKGLI